MFHTQLLENTSNCFVGTYRAHFLLMMIWKVDLVKQYTELHVHVFILHDIRLIDNVVPLMLAKIYLKATCISHECLQSGLVLQFAVAFSHDYKCPSHGPFLRIF